MKYKLFIPILLLGLVFIGPAAVTATAKTKNEAATMTKSEVKKKLENFKVAGRVQNTKRLIEMTDLIDRGVELLSPENVKDDPEMTKELCRVALLSFELDPYLSAAESLIPLYKKNQAAFKAAIKTLPPAQARQLIKAIEMKDYEAINGNG